MIKVSACIITYNQEDFIEECILSAVNQKLNCDYEIVIGDDCSTDKTSQICKKYAENYPNLIKYRQRKTNLGIIKNWLQSFDDCQGKYIAICEGDDFWTDSMKLQKQIDFLENEKNYSMCFHNALEISADKEFADRIFSDIESRDYSGEEIYKTMIVPTASVLVKNDVVQSTFFKEMMQDSRIVFADIMVFLSANNYGKIRGFPEVMSVYRRHEGGAISGKNYYRDLKQNDHDEVIGKYFGDEIKDLSDRHIAARSVVLFYKSFNKEYISLVPPFGKWIIKYRGTLSKMIFNKMRTKF